MQDRLPIIFRGEIEFNIHRAENKTIEQTKPSLSAVLRACQNLFEKEKFRGSSCAPQRSTRQDKPARSYNNSIGVPSA
jgi:hypothetical protein